MIRNVPSSDLYKNNLDDVDENCWYNWWWHDLDDISDEIDDIMNDWYWWWHDLDDISDEIDDIIDDICWYNWWCGWNWWYN